MDLEERERGGAGRSEVDEKVSKSLEEQLRLNEELRQGKLARFCSSPSIADNDPRL